MTAGLKEAAVGALGGETASEAAPGARSGLYRAGKDLALAQIRPFRLLLVTTGTAVGGAEVMLLKLVSQWIRMGFEIEVVSLVRIGFIGEEIRRLGVPVETLGMRRGAADPRALFRLAARIRRFRPDVVQTWMYHADLLGGVAGRLAGVKRVVWGVRHSRLDPTATKRTTRLTARACALLSRVVPAGIICCSGASVREHAKIGYAKKKMIVIPNGFDLERFRPHEEYPVALREELGLSAGTALVGMAARFHPDKDHPTFFRAAGIVSRARPEAHFVLCGAGVLPENAALLEMISAAGLAGRVHLLGERADMPAILGALDVLALSSKVEGFPNVIGEAMASGVLCVTTNAGDAREIVGECGRIVPPGDPGSLAAALIEVLEMKPRERVALGLLARERVQSRYELQAVARQYADLYRATAMSGERT